MELKRYRWTTAMLDVPFLLGAIGASRINGPSLVALLGGLGRAEPAARRLLTRMVDFGALQVDHEGRTNVYRLAPSSHDRYREVEGTSAQPEWTGAFDTVLYHVPERERTLRDRLLYTARSAGFGLLRAGVLISATPRWSRLRLDETEFVGESWLQRVTLTPTGLDEARSMAARAWNLGGLTSEYHRGIQRCVEVLAEPLIDWVTLTAWRDAYATFFNAQLSDPHLPTELLPADWPLARFAAAQDAMNRRIGRPLLPFLRSHADAHDPQHRTEYYPPPWSTA
jgi:phenylacetic acid degradation operon negative regulatory protein